MPTDRKNLFAFTEPGGSFPAYLSVNQVGDVVEIHVRSKVEHGGATAKIAITKEVFEELRAPVVATDTACLSEGQIKHMVDRFLGWRLPANFSPDGGISYTAGGRPVGTNLLDATQAAAMVRHMIEGLPTDRIDG